MQNANQKCQVRVDKDRHLLDISLPEMDDGKPYIFLTFAQATALAKDILRVIRDETADSTNANSTQQWQKDVQDIRVMLERAFGHNH